MLRLGHPELQTGEMYLTNCCFDIFKDMDDSYHEIGWNTKRKGKIAYDNNGNIIEDSYPVFIQIEEYEAKYGKVIEWHQTMKEALLRRR